MPKAREANQIIGVLPGIIICLAVMIIGLYAADLIGELIVALRLLPAGSTSPVSGIFVAILLGILIRNTAGLHSVFMQGISFSVKYALRAGIILLGLRLSLAQALKLGAWGLPLIIACISCGLIVTLYFTKKMNQSKRLGTLIACGTGICGVTAIMATSPVLKAKDDEISYAVANITIFGLIGMLFYPYLANTFFGSDPVKAGLFLGTAIHDTAQVAGSALIYNQIYDMEKVVDIATITKLTRNLFIIAVIPLVSYLFFKNAGDEAGEENYEMPKWYKLIPLFVIGFLLMALTRTIGDFTSLKNELAFGLFSPVSWEAFHNQWSSFGSTYLLGLAMAGVGLSTNFKIFKGLGLKPFGIGLIAALSVGAVSLILVSLFGGLIAA
ncbi:putative sulfate exporter family transporter [Siminovitchia acidinfaciens]|uniref:Sulfate exporter family transporter n=1 Tax=Siminovitchia acidinfaciens TaxID=2321395 RepID=A0A429Y349_9BACI|nr:putative sulfate exporter family transporter [Siminovitchia acidinfaciens]RST75586.1 putative sulfate exporter family transporter [Siminovitchia acidinfaciens]